MAIANVEITDTFDGWRIKTNQLIQQSNQAFNISVASFEYSNNALNNVVIIASNTAANIVASNAYVVQLLTNSLVANVNANAANIILSNTVIQTTIYDNANTIATSFLTNTTLGTIYVQANLAFEQANSAYDKANVGGSVSYAAYDQANLAYDQANTSLSNTNVDFVYTGNLIMGDVKIYSNGMIYML